NPLVVQVTDQHSEPMPGAEVTWTIEAGSGSLSSQSVVSDASGQASIQFLPSTLAGTVTITATVGSLPSATFTVVVNSGAPVGIIDVSGDNQIGNDGSPLPSPVVVGVVDQDGNGVGG